jgi:hypothetical protein
MVPLYEVAQFYNPPLVLDYSFLASLEILGFFGSPLLILDFLIQGATLGKKLIEMCHIR